MADDVGGVVFHTTKTDSNCAATSTSADGGAAKSVEENVVWCVGRLPPFRPPLTLEGKFFMTDVVERRRGRAASTLPRAMYTFEECRQRGGPPRSTLYKLIAQGRGPEVVKIGRRSYITAEAWDAWLRNLPRLVTRKGPTESDFLPPSPSPSPPKPRDGRALDRAVSGVLDCIGRGESQRVLP